MKLLIKNMLAIFIIALSITSCDKAKDLVVASNGAAPALSSVASYTPSAADSTTGKISFNWTDPKYANDPTTSRYEIEIDSTGRNFAMATKRVVIGKLTDAVIAKDWNALLLNLGFKINVPGTIQVRLKSSYGNFNERYISNTISVGVTPYIVPPKIALPTSDRLFLVGDASQGGWTNPIPANFALPQEFTKMDATTWAGVFNLNGNKEFLVVPVNGSYNDKLSLANNANAPQLGGDFGLNLAQNFKGPATSGWYTIKLDFQAGKYYIEPWTGTLPTNLFIVGDATNGGWNNPVPVATQQLTRTSSSEWKVTLPINGGKQYLLLPVNGDWSNKYAVASNSVPGLASGGEFGYNFGDNFPGPAASGTYTITANFVTKKFKVTP